MRLDRGTALLGTLGLLALALPASADLYRCVQPDGRTVYTDSAARCPHAEPHEPRGAVQAVESSGLAPVPPSVTVRHEALEQQAAEGQESYWRAKKRQKQAELRRLESNSAKLRDYVTHCNRGGELYTKDESAIKRSVSCDAVREESEQLEARLQEVRAYLDGGLFEDCRRAGCLPGWLR